MKSKMLIAHHWKILGWLLTIPALLGGMLYLSQDNPEGLTVTLPETQE